MTIAYWSILIAIILPWVCAAYAKKVGHFKPKDNHDARTFMKQLTGKAARANAAQKNSFEIFAPFAAAVIIAHLTGNTVQTTINIITIIFILSRLFYIYLYITDKASLRSLSWVIGVVCIISLYIMAA